jgi:hypothetical protein
MMSAAFPMQSLQAMLKGAATFMWQKSVTEMLAGGYRAV